MTIHGSSTLCVSITLFLILNQVENLAGEWSASESTNYFGVAYSPYVKKGGSPWDMAPLEEIQQMLRIISKYHSEVTTYSMGVNSKLYYL